MNSVDQFLSDMFKTNNQQVSQYFDLQMAFDLYKNYGLTMTGKGYDVSNVDLLVENDGYLYPRKYVVARSTKPTTIKITKTMSTKTETKNAEVDIVEVPSKGTAKEETSDPVYNVIKTKNGWKSTKTTICCSGDHITCNIIFIFCI